MIANPEFRRNLWLEISNYRLIAMPVVLATVFLMIYEISGRSTSTVQIVALSIFVAVTVLWAARLAADNIYAEVRDSTWDIQKLSSLTPWTMTWGKVLGATAYAWYGGVMCLAVFFAAGGDSRYRLTIVCICVCAAVLASSAALLSALLSIRRRGATASSTSNFLVIIMFGAIASFLANALPGDGLIRWYGVDYYFADLLLYSLFVFAAWALTGAYRVMCVELQVRTTPWVWSCFTVFTGVYAAGFAYSPYIGFVDNAAIVASICFGVALGLTYLSVLWDPKNLLTFRQIKLFVQRGAWRRAGEEVPAWSASLALATLTGVGLLVTGADIQLGYGEARFVGAAALPLIFLAARDIALLHYFSFAPNARRPEIAILICLALLYWLVPGLLNLMGLPMLATLVLPPVTSQPLVSVSVAAIHFTLIYWMMTTRWRGRLAQ